MTLENIIKLTKGFTPIEAEIACYILKNENQIPQMSIIELAQNTTVSKSAIHRFCKKIGLNGFNELKIAIVKDLSEQNSAIELIDVNYPFSKQDGPQLIAKKMIKLYENAIQDTYNYINFIDVQQIAYMLNKASIIDIYTHAHNMNVAENFQDKMLTIGKIVNCPKGFYNQRANVLASNESKIAIILSYSGKATFIKPIAKALYQKNIPIILIGKAGSNLYPQFIEHSLSISSKENLRDRISQFSSHIAMQYMLDVIFACIYNIDREKNIEYLKASIDFMDDRDVNE